MLGLTACAASCAVGEDTDLLCLLQCASDNVVIDPPAARKIHHGRVDLFELDSLFELAAAGNRQLSVDSAEVVQTALLCHMDGDVRHARFGWNLRFHDLNGDGDDDLLVTAPHDDSIERDAGALYVWNARNLCGEDTGEGSVLKPDGVVFGTRKAGRFGSALEVMDVNGDGRMEVVVSAPRAFGTAEGKENAGEVAVHQVQLP